MEKYNELIIADNLDVLSCLEHGIFDLIYLDPPFKINKKFRYLSGSKNPGREKFNGEYAFYDVWEWDEECERIVAAWSDPKHKNNELYRFIKLFDKKHNEHMCAYLTNMAVRLMLMRPLLKKSGSIWLHCDRAASHYIKILMDKIYGKSNFINEIVWYYTNASRGKKWLAHSHEVILGYGASRNYLFNRESVLAEYKSGMTAWRYKQKGEPPPAGKTPDDIIIMPSLNTMAKERTGYATQKPRALLEFILKAFCASEGLVLDPFCGCGTTIDAALHTGRQFVGIDINKDVPQFIKQRLEGDSLFEQIDVIVWKDSSNDIRRSNRQPSAANENREAELRIAQKMNGSVTPASGDGGIDVELENVVVSVKNGLSVQLNALREIEGVASRYSKKGVLVLTRRDIPDSWRKYAQESEGKIAVISEKELDDGDIPKWLKDAIAK